MYSQDFSSIPEIDVEALAAQLHNDATSIQLLDVREPGEVAIASLNSFQNIPLSEFAEWSATIGEQLDQHQETWVMCHHGMRSAQVCVWLSQNGFTNVKNVSGGIDAYSMKIDANIPRY
ncbi:rhodanese-related sulfurtransferase [Acaryochloris sp. 'Moss Beach']|uniref:rhodanese-like domain-containing protein n=1 Tax=Acaryochloris TaxID=155977 RepID=UPI001BAEF607|nr:MULTISPECIES: rhodanese-like domain-containing protein [Acaryochloris]QUY41159.1 rhodanese-related sulfurtransferase [Acaryochloris marina S15]UJB70328.1 rhodanese-related sulfurtransferase [Acaryochloris sp. 'Moss Beach']